MFYLSKSEMHIIGFMMDGHLTNPSTIVDKLNKSGIGDKMRVTTVRIALSKMRRIIPENIETIGEWFYTKTRLVSSLD